jgi:hypothetical protein
MQAVVFIFTCDKLNILVITDGFMKSTYRRMIFC